MPTRVFSRRNRLALLPVSLLTLAIVLPSLVMAKDGRDFAGHYAINHVVEKAATAGSGRGTQVSLTMTLQIFNHSEFGDIKTPAVGLMESGPSHAWLGKFGAVKVLPAGRDVIVSGDFTVSKEVFDSWSRRGIGPKVVVMYRDDSGRMLRQNVQLTRRPALPAATGE
jgi:hypothetical protein